MQLDVASTIGDDSVVVESWRTSKTTDDDEADWLVADGEPVAGEADLLDGEGLLEEAESLDEDEVRFDDLPDDEED